MTKKNILWVSAIVSFLLVAVNYFGNVALCTVIGYSGGRVYSCLNFFSPFETMLFPFFVIFLFSLITYKMRDEIFHSWLGFAKWWIPMSMILVLVTPDGQGGGYMPSLIDKSVIAFLTSFIFVIISIIIVTYKSIKLRGK